MKWYVFLVVFLLASLYGGVANATPYQSGNFDPVRPNIQSWNCYDYSIDFARNNPEWGIVTISNNPKFRGISHMVNYKIETDTLYLYDNQYNTMCALEIDNNVLRDYSLFYPCYYKFWSISETPLRNYKTLHDNSMEWLNV